MSSHISRRNFLKSVSTTLACFSLADFRAFAQSPCSKPNIVLIVSDDHGTDALGCYCNPVIKTPNLDSLAADETPFAQPQAAAQAVR